MSPYLGCVHFNSDWNVGPRDAYRKRQLPTADGWTNKNATNIMDVATAIEDVGVQLTKEFVEQHALDAEGCFLTPEPNLQYVVHQDGKPIPPSPPKLNVHGYCCLWARRHDDERLRNIPEGSNTAKIYAIYEGCAKDIIEDPQNPDKGKKLNTDPNAGDTFLLAKFEGPAPGQVLQRDCNFRSRGHAQLEAGGRESARGTGKRGGSAKRKGGGCPCV